MSHTKLRSIAITTMKNRFLIFICTATLLWTTDFSAKAQSIPIDVLRSEIVSDLKNNILPFWEKHIVDPAGGFYGMVGRDGTPVMDAPKGSVLNARILWTFSMAYRLYGNEAYKKLADRAQHYFINQFIDPHYGGVYWSVKADCTPLETDKQTCACAYAIYGLSEHFRATGNLESLQKSIDIYRIMEEKIKDPTKDGYIESFTRKWGIPKRQGFDGNPNATKTLTHIHVLEAYTSLYKVWRDNGLRRRLSKLIDILTTYLYDSHTHHLIPSCDSNWNNLDDIDSYGHDIEASWLLIEAAKTLGDPQVFDKSKEIALELVDTSLKEGIDTATGAMMYERRGNSIRNYFSWWCQAETVVGCINAWQLTGNISYLNSAIHTWNFIKEKMIDRECGEWFRTVSADGIPRYNEPKASLWNCPYHNSRMGFMADEWISK